MPIGVYQIELAGRHYVGSSARDIEGRWDVHQRALKRGAHDNEHLQRVFNKHGGDTLRFSVIEIVERPEDVLAAEQRWIDLLRPEYNMSPVAGSQLGFRHSAETRAKLSAQRLGKQMPPFSAEHRAKISAARKGMKLSDEHRAALSAAQLGKPKSAAHVAKVAAAHVGMKRSAEARENMSAAAKQLNASSERRAKISAALRGRALSAEHRENIRIGMTGTKRGPCSAETRAKISAAHHAYWARRKASQGEER